MYQSYSKLLQTSWRRYLYKSIHLHQDRADIVVTNFSMHQCPNSKNIYIQKYTHTNICMHCTITFGGRVLENNLSNEDKIQNLTMLCHWNAFCVTDLIITHGYLSASNGKDTGEKYFILDMNKNFCEANSFLEVLWNVKGFCLVVKENFLIYFNFVDNMWLVATNALSLLHEGSSAVPMVVHLKQNISPLNCIKALSFILGWCLTIHLFIENLWRPFMR